MREPKAPIAPSSSQTLSSLSSPRQVLVRLCQSVDFGQIIDLHIRDREPRFDPAPAVLLDIKLDSDLQARPELALDDFELCSEMRRLLGQIDKIGDGCIQRIEVRHGLPCRLLVEAKVAGELR